MARNLFLEKNVTCPSCNQSVPMKYPNTRMFAAASRDDDTRITSYSWVQGIKTDMLPHHYAVYQCPNCLYTDFKEAFEKTGTPAIKEKHLFETFKKMPFERKIVLRRLHRLIPKGDLDAEAAIALHMMAIYIALLPEEKEERDHLKLGRLILRLAWLYRENEPAAPVVDEPTGDMSDTLANLSQSVDELHGYFQNLTQVVNITRQTAAKRAAELSLPADNNPYAKLFKTVDDRINQLQQNLAQVKQAIQSDRQGKLKEEANNAQEVTLEQLIPTITPVWPDLPQDEKTAVHMAVDAFDYSQRFEDAAQNVQQAMGLVNLIIKLLVKIGDLDKALKYIVDVFKSGFREKQDLQSRMNQLKRQEKVPPSEIKFLNKQIGTITSTLSQAAETRKKVIDLVYERDKDKLDPLLKKTAAATPEQQEHAILEAGFTEELIPWLRDHGKIKTEQKKKKWFG